MRSHCRASERKKKVFLTATANSLRSVDGRITSGHDELAGQVVQSARAYRRSKASGASAAAVFTALPVSITIADMKDIFLKF
jgi:hypothetical protein